MFLVFDIYSEELVLIGVAEVDSKFARVGLISKANMGCGGGIDWWCLDGSAGWAVMCKRAGCVCHSVDSGGEWEIFKVVNVIVLVRRDMMSAYGEREGGFD